MVLDVIVIPTNKPVARIDTRMWCKTQKAKFNAAVNEIEEL